MSTSNRAEKPGCSGKMPLLCSQLLQTLPKKPELGLILLAGDAFAAALAVRLCLGDALADAAAYAVRYASISTQRPYVLNSYPYAEDLA